MDKQTIDWLIEAINTSPNEYCLDGIRGTCEWFYSIDKDMEAFEHLLSVIELKQQTFNV
jgi:hypothetical protein